MAGPNFAQGSLFHDDGAPEIYIADNLAHMRAMPSESIDLIATDPACSGIL